MPGVVRVGDKDSGGAAVTAGIDSVLVNGKPISVNGKPVSGHGRSPHSSPVTTGGVATVLAGGIPVNVVGNPDSCGHTRAEGSTDVTAG